MTFQLQPLHDFMGSAFNLLDLINVSSQHQKCIFFKFRNILTSKSVSLCRARDIYSYGFQANTFLNLSYNLHPWQLLDIKHDKYTEVSFSLMSTHFKTEKQTKGHDKGCKTQDEQDDE